VAEALCRSGLRIVLTGVAAEADLTREVADWLSEPLLDLTGKTNLGSAAALLEGSRLLVSNDTGLSHLAVAVGTPGVIVSTGDNPARWAPGDASRYRVLCDARGVRPEDVLAEAGRLLARMAQQRRGPGNASRGV
jgi:ADP-heptose:LPS heptosyltransferase